MWRWYTTEDKRKAAAVGLLIAIIGLSAVASGPIIAGSVMIMFNRRSLAGWFELEECADDFDRPVAPAG